MSEKLQGFVLRLPMIGGQGAVDVLLDGIVFLHSILFVTMAQKSAYFFQIGICYTVILRAGKSLTKQMEVRKMALANLFGWSNKEEEKATAECGTACGAGDKPEEAPAACGTACGAGDKPEEAPAACGSACGAGDK